MISKNMKIKELLGNLCFVIDIREAMHSNFANYSFAIQLIIMTTIIRDIFTFPMFFHQSDIHSIKHDNSIIQTKPVCGFNQFQGEVRGEIRV